MQSEDGMGYSIVSLYCRSNCCSKAVTSTTGDDRRKELWTFNVGRCAPDTRQTGPEKEDAREGNWSSTHLFANRPGTNTK